MKKRMLCLFMAAVLSLSVPVTTFAADENNCTAANSAPADVINTICNRISEKKPQLPQTRSEEPLSDEEVDAEIKRIASELSNVRDQIEQENLTEASMSNSALDDLVAQEETLETALAALDTVLLTDEDLELLFSDSDLYVHTGQEDEGISPSSVIDWPSLTTTYSNWTLTNAGISYGEQSCYITAWPKDNRSTLWAEQDDIEIRYPYLKLIDLGIQVVGVFYGMGGSGVPTGQVKRLVGSIAIEIAPELLNHYVDGLQAAFTITEQLTVKLAYVYNESTDEYANTLITHSDAVYYTYAANLFEEEQGGKCGDAVANYFNTSTMLQRANSNFNTNPYQREIDRSLCFEVIGTINGDEIPVGDIMPIYIDSGSQVN